MKVRRVDWYPVDWLDGVASLPPDERGVYDTIINLIYAHGEEDGSIEISERELAIRCACHWRQLRRILTNLMAAGKVTRTDVNQNSCGIPAELLRHSWTAKKCAEVLQKARKRVASAEQNGAKGGRPNGLAKPDGLHPTRARAPSINHQPSTIKENGFENGWKKAEPPRFKQPADYANVHNPLYGPQEDPHVLMARIEAREKAQREAATDRSQPASTVTASPSDASAAPSRRQPRQPRTRSASPHLDASEPLPEDAQHL